MKQFALIVEYGTGKAVMITDTPDIAAAIQQFKDEQRKVFPISDSKDFAFPMIRSCEMAPVLYTSVYEDKKVLQEKVK